jgi:hypothetical protein
MSRKEIDLGTIKSWTGIRRDTTIEGYGMKTQEQIHAIAENMKK